MKTILRRFGGIIILPVAAAMALMYLLMPVENSGFSRQGHVIFCDDSGTAVEAQAVANGQGTGDAGLSVYVGNLVILPDSGAALVFLVTDENDRYLPITIGQFEASAISRSLNSIATQRPMTHDLLLDMISRLGGQIISVTVTSLAEGTFRALIRLGLRDGTEISVDARPSDSIALAVKAGARIFVSASVMEQAGRLVEKESDEDSSEEEAPETPAAPQKSTPEIIL